jgi:peptidoglycan-associated lipoprotein
MKYRAWVVVTLVAVVALAGCQTRKPASKPAASEAPAAVPGTGVTTTADAPATATGIESAGSVGADGGIAGLVPAELDGRRVLYFGFDSSDIRAEDQALVAAHAKVLAANPSLRVRLEGHTDEQGTREYNIGLAERRAQAVRRALALQGAAETQLSTVSYGEERPAAAGDDEAAFAQNRRVELVYGN